jgi:hypothetical protein
MDMRNIERAADSGQNRLLVAEQSLNRWFQKERTKLIEADLNLRLVAAREDNPVKRGALQDQLGESARVLSELNEGMKASSLRAALPRASENTIAAGMIERRVVASPPSDSLPISGAPGRTVRDSAKIKLCGVAAMYDRVTVIAGLFEEIISEGAFDEVLGRSDLDCRCLGNHDVNIVYARSANGTLRLYSRPIGLTFWASLLSDDSITDALIKRIERKDLSGCSFAFTTAEDKWTLRPGKLDRRQILKIGSLFDVSVVTYPAYPDTICQIVHERSKSDIVSTDDYFADVDERIFLESVTRADQRKKEVERQYRYAGRILNRCRSQLQRA